MSLSISPIRALEPIAKRAVPSRPVAYYIGEQTKLDGSSVSLFNLLVPMRSIDRMTIHPIESTISRMTLEANGVKAPRYLTKGQYVMHSAPLAQ